VVLQPGFKEGVVKPEEEVVQLTVGEEQHVVAELIAEDEVL
jgi:hypothetical protein